MSRATELLEQATPLPWGDRSHALGISVTDEEPDYALILYAVNRLPLYEQTVEALGALWDAVVNDGPAEQHAALVKADAALRLLREEVPE